MRKLIVGFFWIVLYGVFKWALDHFLWDWFTQYLETTWHIKETDVITTVSSFVVPALIVGISYWGLWWILKAPVQTAKVLNAQPDMPIADAINYIVNDLVAALPPPRERNDLQKDASGDGRAAVIMPRGH